MNSSKLYKILRSPGIGLLAPARLDALLAAVETAIDDHGGTYRHRYVF